MAAAVGVELSIKAGDKIDSTSCMIMLVKEERVIEGNFHIDHYRLAE